MIDSFFIGIRRQIATATGSRVAFFARLSTPSPKLTSNQAIVFDDIVTNLGGGYNTYNGSFVPPVPGIYVVTTSVLVDKNHSIVSIVKNGQALSSMVVDDDPNTKLHESHSTQTAIVQLEKSDRVSVQNHGSGIIFYGGYFSTFSGFLLYENDYNVDVIG